MSRYTVVWVRSAQDELAELWLEAADRNAVTTAAQAIDQELGENASPVELHRQPRRDSLDAIA